ncbi:hypothetical protein AHF37_10321 [Paragonimus kellicotti]|nr:hypothetical protein AHF37_10321 [Paragonimus kellicotti]
MGSLFSKNDSLEFAVLPSEEISGPLGLGEPDSVELNAVERETLIPALMNDYLRSNRCREVWDRWSDCRQHYRWTAALFCRDLFFNALNCNKNYTLDPAFYEEMKQLYLHMRSEYRRTGLEQKVVRTDG